MEKLENVWDDIFVRESTGKRRGKMTKRRERRERFEMVSIMGLECEMMVGFSSCDFT